MNILSYTGVMRRIMSGILAAISFFTGLIFNTTIPYKTAEFDLSDYELTWSDEFDGSTLDYSKWGGHFFERGQTAVRRGSYWNMDLCSVKDGNLHISTKYYPEGINGNGKPGWYTAGIDTDDTFSQKYGYFECRCILPKGGDIWSAFWMFCDGVGLTDHDGEKGAEIDIYESLFNNEKTALGRNKVSSNIHINGYGEYHRKDGVCEAWVTSNNPYEEFNTYGLLWNESEYVFYINGVESGRTSFGVSQVPEWLILSIEVAGKDGIPGSNFTGNDLTDFVVDYVRVYSPK